MHSGTHGGPPSLDKQTPESLQVKVAIGCVRLGEVTKGEENRVPASLQKESTFQRCNEVAELEEVEGEGTEWS